MSGGIYAIQRDGQLVEMLETAYESEARLQEYLEKHHSLLAGDQMDTRQPRRWVLVKREAQLPSEEEGAARWSVDHLFLDQDAIPTIVEVKRSSDTRIRREVVGQMLDYAANAVVYWPVERIRAMFEAQHGDAADQVLGALLASPGSASLAEGIDAEQFWQKVKTNLQAGRVRLVFIADYIPPELRRIVEFLNQQMDPAEVLAVEIRQYVGQGLRTLVPRIIGQTAQAQQKKSSGGANVPRWDEGSLLTDMVAKHGQRSADVVRQLLRWAEMKMPDIFWGLSDRLAYMVPGINHKGQWHQVIGLLGYGKIEVQFQYMKSKSSPFTEEAARKELLQRLNTVPGISLPLDAYNARPSFHLVALNDDDAVRQFLSVLEWFVDQVLAS